jgi:hypothetical protein
MTTPESVAVTSSLSMQIPAITGIIDMAAAFAIFRGIKPPTTT